KSVVISGDAYTTTNKGQDVSAVYVSPSYVGCDNVGNSLYTSLSLINSFDSSFTVKDSHGLLVGINGDYSIANKADALTLTVNNDVHMLYGSNNISESYEATSFTIGVKWTKKQGSQDRFALQIDVASVGPEAETNTTISDVGSTTTNVEETTTSSVKALEMLVSCL
ncbi:hypothetical protein PENTCL1PPCAC_18900, partial [Pristionchus entomophagus]